MRIARLDLTRYGRFTDRSLDLPAGEVDLHLVVGRNEAGKSTTRAGLSELLFGIDTRTPYAFLHDYQSMRIGAVLERGERRLVIQRRKGNKNTLLGEDGQPLGDGALAPFLGAADRAFFERMFSLDLEALAEGGRQLLDAKDDIGRMLFQASGGLARFGEVLDELDRELEQLWAPRKSGTRAYYTAHDQLEAADKSFKEGVVRAQDFHRAEAAVDEARGEVDRAAQRHATLVRERSRLERIKRVSPALARRRKLLDDVVALANVALLPSSAARDLQDATAKIALADADLERLARDVAQAAATRDAAVVDDKLLSHAADIRAAGERRQQLKSHPGEIGNCITEVHLLTSEVEDLAGRLGWGRGSLDDLRAHMPSELAQQELGRLIAGHEKLLRERDAAAKALADRVAERNRLASDRDPSRDGGPPDALVDALERARKLGDADRARQRLADPAKALSKKVDSARKQLAPWTGDVEALRAVVPPPDEEIEAIASRLARIDQARDQARAERSTASGLLDQRRLEERQVRRDARPVTADELAGARAVRDERWSGLRASIAAGAPPREAEVDELSRLVAEADALAVRRFDAAEASVELQKIRADIELGDQHLASLDARLREHDEARDDARRALVALQRGLGVALDTPAALRAWVHARAHVLDLAAQTQRSPRRPTSCAPR
ncbi:MAG: AAA family ATPase [Deltaproteobacteria bacterium]|nr:AAA family ATPase [Deltaproteobacteria bacterium]